MSVQGISSTSQTATGKLTRRNAEWAALLSVARDLAREPIQSRDFPDALNQALEKLTHIIPQIDLAWILVHEPASDSLRVIASVGYDRELMRQVALKRGESISGKVFRDGRPYLLETPEAVRQAMADLTPRNRELLTKVTQGRILHSALAAPLAVGDRLLGVLVLENLAEPTAFTACTHPFAQALADLLALAIDRARYREEAESLRVSERTNQVRADILSAISHELRTPLASIKGYATALLLDEVEWDKTRQGEFLQSIDEECNRLEEIVRDFLDAARIEAGRLEIEFQPVMLARLVQAEVDGVSRHTTIHRFVMDFPPDFPVVDADPVRISQVLHNLLDNAVKYSPQGGLVVIRGMVTGDEVVISVSDQGVGIAPQDLNQLFDHFFRVKAPAGYYVAGSGLGLPIAQSIVESHGGRIWAESQAGQGTTLYFSLPRVGLSADLNDKE